MKKIALTIPEGSPRNFFEDLEILNFHFLEVFFLSLDLNRNQISARAEILILQGYLYGSDFNFMISYFLDFIFVEKKYSKKVKIKALEPFSVLKILQNDICYVAFNVIEHLARKNRWELDLSKRAILIGAKKFSQKREK